jgi:hypothetical protein
MEIREGYKKLIVEGDSMVIISMLERMQHGSAIGKISTRWILEGGLERLQSLLPLIEVIIPSHVRCSTNKLRETLVNEGITKIHHPLERHWDPHTEYSLSKECLDMEKTDFPSPNGVIGGNQCHVHGQCLPTRHDRLPSKSPCGGTSGHFPQVRS